MAQVGASVVYFPYTVRDLEHDAAAIPPDDDRERRMTTRTRIVASALVVALLGAGAFALRPSDDAGRTDATRTSATPKARSPPAPPPPLPRHGRRRSRVTRRRCRLAYPQPKGTMQRLLKESTAVLSKRRAKADEPVDKRDLAQYAVGSALDEVVAQAEYNNVERWTQVGAPTIVWVKVDPAPSNAKTMTAQVCLDSSGVSVVDSRGTTQAPSPHARTVNLYVLRKSAGKWKVAEHSFPAKADC